MKDLRVAAVVIVGMLICSVSTRAQEDRKAYQFLDDRTTITISIYEGEGTKATQVLGRYFGRDSSCAITGSFLPTTGLLRGLCTDDNGMRVNVTGFKLDNQDAFQVTIGKYVYVVRSPQLSLLDGTWEITQNMDGGPTYRGKLYLKEDEHTAGRTFTGTAAWDNHQQGTVNGTWEADGGNRYVTFTIYYSDGLEGYYKATFSDAGSEMVGGTARANKGGPTVAWEAHRLSGGPRVKPRTDLKSSDDWLGTVWDETEYNGNAKATWTRQGKTNVFHADWGGVTATLTIARDGNVVTITRTNSSDGNNCMYRGILSSDGINVSGLYKCAQYTPPEGLRWSAIIR